MKKLMLICAPVSSRSGYGDHARDLVRAFLKINKFEVKIIDVNWGETPRNALDSELDKNIIDCLLPEPKMDKQPDVYVDIRIPNEFQTYGKLNIGITAGIETTAVSQSRSQLVFLISIHQLFVVYHLVMFAFFHIVLLQIHLLNVLMGQ